MIISEKTYFPLKYLSPKWDGMMGLRIEDADFYRQYGKEFMRQFKQYVNLFRGSINIVSKSFAESAEKARPKLIGLLKDIAVNDSGDFSNCGVYILGDWVHMVLHRFTKGSERIELAYFVFHKDGSPAALWVDDVSRQPGQIMWVSNAIQKKLCAK